MSINPREVWPSLPADRRRVILGDLAALFREISHDLGPHCRFPADPDRPWHGVLREVFLERFPSVPRVKAARGYSFLVGLMLSVFTQSRRIDALSDNTYSGADLETAVNELVPFVAAGLRALATGRGDRPANPPGSKAKPA